MLKDTAAEPPITNRLRLLGGYGVNSASGVCRCACLEIQNLPARINSEREGKEKLQLQAPKLTQPVQFQLAWLP